MLTALAAQGSTMPARKVAPQTCRTCRFWNANIDPTDAGNAFPTITSGSCRRNAPQPRAAGDLGTRACWPETVPEDWCGDYSACR
jgi:hypothetical protein